MNESILDVDSEEEFEEEKVAFGLGFGDFQILLYALCPLLYALFARNSQHTTRNEQRATIIT